MSRYRAAVIGAGRIGLTLEGDPKRAKPASHAGMWLTYPDTDLVALCDPNPTMPEVASAIAPDAVCYTDAEAMLAKERPDIVSIATHQDSHVEIALLAIENGARAIVCEKPLSDSVADGENLINVANQAGVHLIVNHARRFDPMLADLAKQIDAGVIGDLIQATGYYVYGLQSTGTHMVDTLRLLVGRVAGEMSWVSGWHNKKSPFHPDGDPCIDAVIGFENGAKAVFQSLDMKDYDCFDIALYGRNGKIALSDRARRAEIFPVVAAQSRSGFTDLSLSPSQVLESDGQGYFAALGQHAVACLDGTDLPRSNGSDSLIALQVLNAIRHSADRDGTAVHLPPQAV